MIIDLRFGENAAVLFCFIFSIYLINDRYIVSISKRYQRERSMYLEETTTILFGASLYLCKSTIFCIFRFSM